MMMNFQDMIGDHRPLPLDVSIRNPLSRSHTSIPILKHFLDLDKHLHDYHALWHWVKQTQRGNSAGCLFRRNPLKEQINGVTDPFWPTRNLSSHFIFSMTRPPLDLDDPETVGRFLSTMRSRAAFSQNPILTDNGEVERAAPSPGPINGLQRHGGDESTTPARHSPPTDDSPPHNFQPRPSPSPCGLLPPNNTPLTAPVSPKPVAKDKESPIQNPTAVGEALYDYVQSIEGVPLSESMWAPKTAFHRPSFLKEPRAASRELTPIKAVEPNPDINDTSTRMSFKAADAGSQTLWLDPMRDPEADPFVMSKASSGKPSDSKAPSKTADNFLSTSQRATAVLKQNEREERERSVERKSSQAHPKKDGKGVNKELEVIDLELSSIKYPAKNNISINSLPLESSTFNRPVTGSIACAENMMQDTNAPENYVRASYVPPHLRHEALTSRSPSMPVPTGKIGCSTEYRPMPTQFDDHRLPTTSVNPRYKGPSVNSGLWSDRALKYQASRTEVPLKVIPDKEVSIEKLKEDKQGQLCIASNQAAAARLIEDAQPPKPMGAGTTELGDSVLATSPGKIPELKVDEEDRETQSMFTSWGTPEVRDRPGKYTIHSLASGGVNTDKASQIRKVIIKGLPKGSTAGFVASLVFGGPVEQIHMSDGATASVKFLHGADCKKFYDETSNGLVYGTYPNGRERIVWVSLAKDVDVVGGMLRQWITSDFTRCVRAVPVDEDLGKEYLWKMASRKNRSVEGIEDGQNPGGVSICPNYSDTGESFTDETCTVSLCYLPFHRYRSCSPISCRFIS